MTDDRSRWNSRYRDLVAEPASINPPEALLDVIDLLPTDGVAVDIAGGTGDTSLCLAERGLESVLVEVSDVAIDLATARAAARGLGLATVQLDVAGRGLGSVIAEAAAPGAVSLITCFHYLDRALLASVPDELPAGATFVVGIATVDNLERHERPPRRFLLEAGELERLVHGGDPRLELVTSTEGWNRGGRHEAVVVVRA